ncbi:MAG: succinate dehydrogenase, cytochrome b556 subunit [Caulobacterales bacterium]
MAEGGSAAAVKKAGAPERPLSPHLQVWRWHATMWTSILHRATGIGLYGGAIFFTLWLVSVSLGPQIYGVSSSLIGSPVGQIVLWAILFCACFHILSGLRHLVWDVGFGFKKQTASFWSVVIVLGAIAMTAGLYVWVASAPPPPPQFGGMPIQ